MPKENKAFEFGPFRLEVRERRLTRDGHAVSLRGRVFDTLYTLVSRHGCLVTKDELMAAVWPDSVVEETNLNHNICVLRRALGERATGQKYVETVPRQGYRFVARVKELDGLGTPGIPYAWGSSQDELVADMARSALPGPPSDSRLQPVIPAAEKNSYLAARPRRLFSPAIIALLVVAGILAIVYIEMQRFQHMTRSSSSRTMLVVLPFDNLTGDSAQQYVADGLSHEIIAELGLWNPRKLGVIARTSSKVYEGLRKPVSEIGRELGVDYIVEGSVRRSDSRLRITVMLIRVDDQAQLWAANYERAIDNVMAVQVEVASRIVREIGSRIAVEQVERSHMAYPVQRATAVSIAILNPRRQLTPGHCPCSAERPSRSWSDLSG